MGIMDKIMGLVKSQPDKVGGLVDKAAEMADEKTGGKFGDQISKATDMAKDQIDGQAEGAEEADMGDIADAAEGEA